jgi:MraZ protein
MSQLLLPLFQGEDRRLLDSKGRLVIPAQHRARLGNPFIVTRGTGGVLCVFPDQVWLAMLRAHEDDAAFLGFYLSGASLVEWEPHCLRWQVPYALREYADLPIQGEAVIAGAGAALVIASPDRWQAHLGRWESELARRAATEDARHA